MATDVERLIVSLEASTKKYENALNRAMNQSKSALKEVEASLTGLEDAVDSSFKKIAGIVGAGVFANEVKKMVDTWQEAGNKIKAAGVDDAIASATQNAIADIASRSRGGFEEVADLYARLTRTGKTFGATQGEIATATETVTKALKISGASASEVQSTLVQLGQALGSGRLQGDELRSILENAPVVAGAIAKEFGVAVGELKNLGSQGELTSERVFSALVKVAPEVEKAFAKTKATISDSFKILETAAIKYVGNSSQVTAASALVSKSIQLLANNLDVAATAATALGAVIATRVIAAGLAPMVASVGTAVAAAGVAAGGFGTMGVAATAAAGALGVLRVALLLVGGPIGAAILGLGAAIAFVATRSDSAVGSSQAYADAIARIEAPATTSGIAVKKLGDAVGETQAKMDQARIAKLSSDLENTTKAIASTTAWMNRLVEVSGNWERLGISPDQKAQALDIVRKGMVDVDGAAEKAARQLIALGDANPDFGRLLSNITETMSRLAGLRAEANATRAAIAGATKDAAANSQKSELRKSFLDLGIPEAGPAFDGTAMINRDPDVAAQRLKAKVILAEMDDTKRKIKQKTEELYKQSQEEGGGITLAQAEEAAKRIVAAETPEKKERKGPKTPEDKFADDVRKIQERTAANELEEASLKKLNYEREREKAILELTNEAKKAGLTLTPAVKAQIEELATSYAKSADSLKNAKDKMQEWQDLQRFIGNSLSGFFSDVVSGGKNAERALENLIKKLIEAALQAALLGEGPLAGAFGTKGVGGSQGGIIGSVVGGFFRADGGPVKKGQPYVVGEKRPELFVPDTSGRIIPKVPTASAIGGAGRAGGAMGAMVQMGDTIVRVMNGGNNKVAVDRNQQNKDGSRMIDISIIDDRIAESLGKNGQIAKVLQNRYGLSRMAGSR